MSFKINRSNKSAHKHALKSAIVLIGVAFVLALLIAAAGMAQQQKEREAAQQAQVQKEADEKAAQAAAADAQKQKADYEKCISDANSQYSDGLSKIPSELYGTARIEAAQTIGNLVDSFKKDCDRMYQMAQDN